MNKSDRLTLEQWNEIDIAFTEGLFTPTEVSKKYKVSRNSLYAYAKRHNKTNWFKKDKKINQQNKEELEKLSVFQKAKRWLFDI